MSYASARGLWELVSGSYPTPTCEEQTPAASTGGLLHISAVLPTNLQVLNEERERKKRKRRKRGREGRGRE